MQCVMKQSRGWQRAALIAAIIVITGCESKSDLSGQLFVVTNARANVLLGGEVIRIYRKPEILQHIQAVDLENVRRSLESDKSMLALLLSFRSADELVLSTAARVADFHMNRKAGLGTQSEVDDAIEDYKKTEEEFQKRKDEIAALEARVVNVESGAFLLDGLPQALLHTVTDANGEFSVQLPGAGDFVIVAMAKRSFGSLVEEQYCWLVAVSLEGGAAKRIMLTNKNAFTAHSLDSPITEIP